MEFKELDGIEVKTATSVEEILSNIKTSIAQPHKEIYDTGDWRTMMPVAIVGGGPSLKTQLDLLRRYKLILACGSVHDYLVENGIIPTWTAVCDADPIVNLYMQNLPKTTKYLVASQCSQETFNYLKNNDVYIWHACGNEVDDEVFGKNKVMIGGGCTIGTRAMSIALGMGFKHQHLFGFDTCLEVIKNGDGELSNHHSYKFQTEEEEIGDIMSIRIGPDSPTFKVVGYMLGQLFDFKLFLKQYAGELDVEVFGDGLLKYIVDYGRTEAQVEKEELLNGYSY